jgi:hypothetical protein
MFGILSFVAVDAETRGGIVVVKSRFDIGNHGLDRDAHMATPAGLLSRLRRLLRLGSVMAGDALNLANVRVKTMPELYGTAGIAAQYDDFGRLGHGLCLVRRCTQKENDYHGE